MSSKQQQKQRKRQRAESGHPAAVEVVVFSEGSAAPKRRKRGGGRGRDRPAGARRGSIQAKQPAEVMDFDAACTDVHRLGQWGQQLAARSLRLTVFFACRHIAAEWLGKTGI